MTCVAPPELADRELLAYIDDPADGRVAVHLERCAHCRERVKRLARVQERLTARLYRLSCPPAVELGEYHLGVLDTARAATIAAHVAGCVHCSREVAQLEGYLGDLASDLMIGPLEQFKEQVTVLVASLVGGAGRAGPAPAFAGVRGEQAGPLVYQADDVQVVLEIQDDAEHPDRKTILGLVTGKDPQGMQVSIWQDDQLVTQAPVDDLGNFLIPKLLSGSYELIVTGLDVEIHIPALAL